ncbi:DUF134 domain-containing protein [Desulfosudis oleivorans]|uniref:UPF0251 protein Dole_1957 n=1 Tax=Desulfosudis oleivorans (strain DSM 6200 / JCM 39069 / Hxd3) TaxID=96561 RepID=Y1957_DESOH|nr:DUF134 domain-containing protein [Desulfosudis oleivorans]A8ZT78.1 RecName: Full=UPF0251 protein Dole_1957 [Desulfosudis oleivorans Hxd3]ABW67761.1 protein of unknown function DUF134 [Desulfosudis oleivorans Hxd3]
MPRPTKTRTVVSEPDVCYFKPRGVPLRMLREVGLTVDELEALMLADLQGLPHEEAGRHMNISRATFGRVVRKARKTVADALVNGMAIRIEGGNYLRTGPDGAVLFCGKCRQEWPVVSSGGTPHECPMCKKEEDKKAEK